MTRNAKSNYYKDCLSNNLKNPKQFWNNIKYLLNTSDKSIIKQIKGENTIVYYSLSIAQVFGNFFSTVCSNPTSNYSSMNRFDKFTLSDSTFTFNKIKPIEVLKVIEQLSSTSGAGPDGIEPRYVKLASHILMYPLADLFNMSLQSCELPAIWKHSRITPIYKGGDIIDPQNYRPISIISVIVKVFEKLIYNQISMYLENNNILSPFQSGFRPKYSTTSALLKLTNDIYSALDSGDLIGAIFIDLKKAFDLVDHYLLLDKLYAVGFSKNSLLWFNSYLHNRKQCVVVQGKLSDLFIHERGVPQGSVLGPLLFSIFINDLPLILSHCSVHLYADDTVIYVSNPHLTQIQNMLQSDFNALQEWLYSNNLLLNKGKSQTMFFGTKRMIK